MCMKMVIVAVWFLLMGGSNGTDIGKDLAM